MFKTNIILIALAAVLSVMVWGCAGNLPESDRTKMVDMNWGKSFESAKNNQILNPEAGMEPEPVLGLDGEAAGYNMKNYRDAFKEAPPAKAPVLTTIISGE